MSLNVGQQNSRAITGMARENLDSRITSPSTRFSMWRPNGCNASMVVIGKADHDNNRGVTAIVRRSDDKIKDPDCDVWFIIGVENTKDHFRYAMATNGVEFRYLRLALEPPYYSFMDQYDLEDPCCLSDSDKEEIRDVIARYCEEAL